MSRVISTFLEPQSACLRTKVVYIADAEALADSGPEPGTRDGGFLRIGLAELGVWWAREDDSWLSEVINHAEQR